MTPTEVRQMVREEIAAEREARGLAEVAQIEALMPQLIEANHQAVLAVVQKAMRGPTGGRLDA
jgi:hypothetical protein